jgi:CubicO group peptidase (beta-lactamase class C family)
MGIATKTDPERQFIRSQFRYSNAQLNCVLTFLLLLSATAFAGQDAGSDPIKAGMDPQGVAAITARMQAYVDEGYIPGVVTLVQRKGIVAQFEAIGWQDVEAAKPMRPDSIFQIMSMSKPIAGVAAMMMVEEGKIRLNDPVEKHLPEFRGQWMIDSKSDDRRVLKKPSHPITIRDLMTHTSGMISDPPPGIAEVLIKMDRTLAEAVAIYAQQPLEFEPGSRWLYSSPGIATLGRIVEVASGMPYEEFVRTRIFQPLEMKNSYIFLPAEKHSRLAAVYTLKEGKMVKAGDDLLAGNPLNYRHGAKYSGPELAVYSTAQDLAAFYQMMLNRGYYNGRRLLSPASVEVMTTVQTGELKAGWVIGSGFGLTWEVTKDPIGQLTLLSPGTFHHGGAFGTFGWIDPKKDMVGVFLIQWSGNRQDVRDAFIAMAGAAVLP